MTKYKCTIWSNNSREREYDVDTVSAIKAAQMYGRCEDGEVVQIRTASGKLINEARWTPKNGGKYYRTYSAVYAK